MIRLMLQEVKNMPPGFWAWFGDSVLVNPDGSPVQLYHGTQTAFNAFRLSQYGKYGPGIYLTGSPENAAGYAMGSRHETDGSGSVMPLYVRLENPLTIIAQEDGSNRIKTRSGHLTPGHAELQDRMSTVKGAVNTTSSPDFMQLVKSLGHDGIIVDFSDSFTPEMLDDLDTDIVIEEFLQHLRLGEVVVFSPTQIKSAISNVGSWSKDDEDISLEQ